MNILVAVSRVPDTATKIAIDGNGKAINETGVKFILNPYDEYAVEEALQKKAALGGTVTVATVGGDASQDVLRTALAMGADRAVIIKAEVSDTFQAVNAFTEFAKTGEYDLILTGRQSIDYDSFQFAPMAAEMLNVPCVTMVTSLEIDGSTANCKRDIEGGSESISAPTPCVIAVQKGINEPRYPKLPDIMKAKKKPIDTVEGASVDARVEIRSMELPPAKTGGKILGNSDADIAELVRLLQEEAKAI